MVRGVDTLGEDLVLLSLHPRSGRVTNGQTIRYGLMGAELVRLAAMGRIDIQSGGLAVLNDEPTGDAQLDVALASITRARRPPKAESWVSRPRDGICDAYLARLAAAGCVQKEGRLLTRWRVADAARLADARARLDAIATSAGRVDLGQAAFGGLAHAAGLDTFLYPGRHNRDIRRRLQEVAKGQWTESFMPATHAAAEAATHAALHAATHAAVHAATHAAVHATVHASASAAHSGGGGGHGGH